MTKTCESCTVNCFLRVLTDLGTQPSRTSFKGSESFPEEGISLENAEHERHKQTSVTQQPNAKMNKLHNLHT
jgi:hypothetical protein